MKRKLMFALILPLLFCLGCAARAQNATIQKVGDDYQIHAAKYDAVVASDGTMPSLVVNGQEFLNPKVSIARGLYFWQGDTQKLTQIAQPAPNVITAKNEKFSIRYEFGADTMTWTATNNSDAGVALYALFALPVGAVSGGNNEFVAAPINRDWPTATFYRGNARLQMEDGNRTWGPWSENTQVYEASLAPKETRVLHVTPGTASAAEIARATEAVRTAQAASSAAANAQKAALDAAENALAVLSPRTFQVFQRQTKLRGEMPIAGRVPRDCDTVEARISGGKPLAALQDAPLNTWRALSLDASTRSFNATLQVPAGGWYKVEVRALKAGKVVAQTSVENVGVGEVFVGSGQSNSTNYGEKQTKTQTKMVSTFDGTSWRIADDPQPGVHDQSGGGSFWPAFGDALATKYGVPIGVATTGHGGTSVNAWQPGGELFGWTLMRVMQLGRGGFRAMLWHQGESDVGMTSDEYARKLSNTIRGMQAQAGWSFPWIVAQVSYLNPGQTSFATTRDAQAQLWATGVALQGPDTDLLATDNRDGGGTGIHFSEKGLGVHGKAWADKVSVYLDKVVK